MNATLETTVGELLAKRLPYDSFWDAISYADRRIKFLLRETPANMRHYVWDSFGALQPDDYMLGIRDGVWMSHIDELLTRAQTGADLAPLTSAEWLAAFHKMTVQQKLGLEGGFVMWHHFAKVFPQEADKIRGGDAFEEMNFDNIGERMLADLQRHAPEIKRKYEHNRFNSWHNLDADERAAILRGR